MMVKSLQKPGPCYKQLKNYTDRGGLEQYFPKQAGL